MKGSLIMQKTGLILSLMVREKQKALNMADLIIHSQEYCSIQFMTKPTMRNTKNIWIMS